MSKPYVVWFNQVRMSDVAEVGGKNASLGEMISQLSQAGLRIPDGFATTADAYRDFLKQNNLDKRIATALEKLDVTDVKALAETGTRIRLWIMEQPLPPQLEQEITVAYQKLLLDSGDISVAVRSSATAEDLPGASFAGQQETLLNVYGLENLLSSIKRVFSSLYNDRAIAYRVHQGFGRSNVALSAGVQRMVRSDLGASGVMFTLDTESGFDQVVFVTASYGLGETIVQGAVNPDEFYVYKPNIKQGKPAILRRKLGTKEIKMVFAGKQQTELAVITTPVAEIARRSFCISDSEVEHLSRCALIVEEHYRCPMDIEWGKDGIDGNLYILQARPETVKSQASADVVRRYRLKQHSEVLISGSAIGQRIGSGPVRLLTDASQMSRVQQGDVLVTDMTDPDWEPVMQRSSAIVTNRGGRTCHAAIIARELGIPAIVGCGNATQMLKENELVTVSCAEGDTGKVYRGILETEVTDISIDTMPILPVKISLNIGNPDLAFDLRQLPNAGVGLARLEFIIARMIGIHPQTILEYPDLPEALAKEVERRASGYSNPVNFYVEKLVEGISTLSAAFWPKPVIVRLSDFKSNEYAGLIGGERCESKEENPMLGFRGAARYLSPSFAASFGLECNALKKVRDELGFTNVEIMVPFVRTVDEAAAVIGKLEEMGLKRGVNRLRLIMMCEVPSNAILAEQFLEYFDGFSIGSNDLTQLTLGIDRDSSVMAYAFDERNPAVKTLAHMAIQACRKANKYVGICGQGPSDHTDFARWLVAEGIDALSLNPDTVIDTWLYLARVAVTPAASTLDR